MLVWKLCKSFHPDGGDGGYPPIRGVKIKTEIDLASW